LPDQSGCGSFFAGSGSGPKYPVAVRSLLTSGLVKKFLFRVKKYALDPEKQRKTGSHLTAVQMCLSFAGWYTLEELMCHNRPENEDVKK